MNQEQLKHYLQIKRQLKYVTKQAENVKRDFPNNKEAYATWDGMKEAYNIALQIMEGKEL